VSIKPSVFKPKPWEFGTSKFDVLLGGQRPWKPADDYLAQPGR